MSVFAWQDGEGTETWACPVPVDSWGGRTRQGWHLVPGGQGHRPPAALEEGPGAEGR